MKDNFTRITDIKTFEELLNQSRERPIVLFKHSTTCSVSASAYQEMKRFDGEVLLVEVQNARALSCEIENRTRVAHESPQVLVLRNGQAVWNASHWKVNAEKVADAVMRST